MNQLELFIKLVAIQITSEEGHKTIYLEPDDALTFIRDHCESWGMWVYVDSYFVKADQLTTSILLSARKILLNSVVMGG
jgi:hypothetical protein